MTAALDIFKACKKAFANSRRETDFCWLDKGDFAKIKADSIDYAVMEKTADAVMVPLDAGWNDIGSWEALAEHGNKDEKGNITLGQVVTEDVANCYLRAENKLIAAIGVKDLIVVETEDAVLVTTKARAQDVKKIVEKI